MELNKKCVDMVMYLRDKDDYVHLNELAEHYQTSNRSIRYNLDKIERYLVGKGFTYFERERSKGVMLPRDEELLKFIDQIAVNINPYQYQYDTEERKIYLLSRLLQAKEPIFLDDLCTGLKRSRNTILKDLETVADYLEERDLELVKKPRVGIVVEGSALKKRSVLSTVLFGSLLSQDILQYIRDDAVSNKFSQTMMSLLVPSEHRRLIESTLRLLEQKLDKEFSDHAFSNLIVHFAMMINRIEAGDPIQLVIPPEDYVTSSKEWKTIHQLLGEIEEGLDLKFPRDEIDDFTYHVLGSKALEESDTIDLGQEDKGLRLVIERMVAEIEQIYRVEFAEFREEIIRGIYIHLKPTIYRLRYGLFILNPLYNEVVSDYNTLFINTRIVAHHLVEYLGTSISDQEVSFLALHFGAALYRVNKRTNHRARIIVVCGTGLGSAKLITSQLEKQFNVDVVDTVAGRKIQGYDLSGIDHIVSTIPLSFLEREAYIQVTPSFNEQDRKRLGRFLSLRYTPQAQYDREVNMANRLVEIVDKYCEVTDKAHLQYEFLKELMNRKPEELQSQLRYHLSDILTKDLIALSVKCSDWREAIVKGAEILEGKDYVEPRYKDAIIRNLEEYGPYLVMLPGMVFSHASIEDGTKKLAMSLMTLKNPVSFGHDEYDPVSIVVTLSATDQEMHLKALAQLFRILKDRENFRKIATRATKEEIMEIFMHEPSLGE